MNKNMERKLLLICLTLYCMTFLRIDTLGAQEATADTTRWAIKTNLLGWATTSINLAGEVTLDERNSLNLAISYNPFTFADNRKWRHILVQPEWRYWTDHVFNGHFFGIHTGYTFYNISGVRIPFQGKETADHRYQGWATGLGISYGYSWILGKRWNIEATIGFGYAYSNYDKYDCATCGRFKGSQDKHYFGPTKAGISLIYIIK